jgi:nicotinate-nucleotide adenylyltransferase
MGEDNLKSLHKWKNYEAILKHHDIYVYPRIELIEEENIEFKTKNQSH